MGLLSGQMDPLGRFMKESGGVSRDSCFLKKFHECHIGMLTGRCLIHYKQC